MPPRYCCHPATHSAPRLVSPVQWVLLLLLCTGEAGAQTEQGARLDMGADKGNPGSQVFLPLIFSPAAGVRLPRLEATLFYPGASLRFDRVHPSGSAPETVVSAEVQGDATAARAVLRVVIETASREGVPAGLLANLGFTVREEVAAGETVSVEGTAQGLRESGEAVPLETAPGEIRVVDMPVVFACHFYMH